MCFIFRKVTGVFLDSLKGIKMKLDSLYTEMLDSGILKVTINCPATLNALNMQVLEDLEEVFRTFNRDRGVRVIILTGAGEKAFIAGADIEQMSDMGPLEFREYIHHLSGLATLMDECEKPLIGAVKGFTFGGGNIVAMHCDLIFASDDSSFGQQEINLGIMGGLPRLAYLVGLRRAFDIVVTGRILNAKEAEEIGLINKCMPREELDSFVLKYCQKLVAKPAVAMTLIKASKRMCEKTAIDMALKYEDELMSLCFASTDAREGLKAFVEKRKPVYTGQ